MMGIISVLGKQVPEEWDADTTYISGQHLRFQQLVLLEQVSCGSQVPGLVFHGQQCLRLGTEEQVRKLSVKMFFRRNKIGNGVPKLSPRRVKEVIHA